GNLYDLQRVEELERAFLAALDVEADQRRAALHLPRNEICLRMVLPAGVNDTLNRWVLGEDIRDMPRALGLLPDAQRKRLEALQQRPGIERRERRACVTEIV